MLPSNGHFDLTGLPLAMCLAVAAEEFAHVTHYGLRSVEVNPDPNRAGQDDTPPAFLLGWSTSSDDPARRIARSADLTIVGGARLRVVELGMKLPVAQMQPLIEAWLADVEYPRQPDLDGSCHKGWRVWNSQYGRIYDGWWFAAIEPVWWEYHK